jgi:uncharacterized protein YegL
MMPVIILADVSGSMTKQGKIAILNRAIASMIQNFADDNSAVADIHIAVITFGKAGAVLHIPLTPASKIQWEDMNADGTTPMAAAFELVNQLVEDRNTIPSRSYYPNLILVSDGVPTDERGKASKNWQASLSKLLASDRASKAVRFAMGIGEDIARDVLNAFVANQSTQIPVFAADETNIQRFFRWVTFSVATRSRSADPSQIQQLVDPDTLDLDDIDF